MGKKKVYQKKALKKPHALGDQRARQEQAKRRAVLAKLDPATREIARKEFEKKGLL
jgi:hypothetical protein